MRLITAAPVVTISMSGEFWDWYRDYRFAIPLLFGIVGLGLLAFPVRRRSGEGSAALTPRTPFSFVRGRWEVLLTVVLAIVISITVAAGMASQPDPETGRYTMYFVDLGGERGMGTGIYGWFSSTPCLILIGVMIAVAAIDLFLIARPALCSDRERDVSQRIARSRNIFAVTTGALLMHLAVIFSSLAGTASIRASFSTSEGPVSFWTIFAALEPALGVASHVASALGIALWVTVALSALPSSRPAASAAS